MHQNISEGDLFLFNTNMVDYTLDEFSKVILAWNPGVVNKDSPDIVSIFSVSDLGQVLEEPFCRLFVKNNSDISSTISIWKNGHWLLFNAVKTDLSNSIYVIYLDSVKDSLLSIFVISS
jgi:hypothetical protein